MSWRGDDVRLRITQRAPAKSARSSSSCDTCRRPACRVARPAGLHMGSVHLSELALDRLRGASCQPCMTLCSLPCFQGTPPDYLFAHKPCPCSCLPECLLCLVHVCIYFMNLLQHEKSSYLSTEMKFSQKRGLFKIDNYSM